MSSQTRRLLLVDAPSGPPPDIYGPRLPTDIAVRVITVVVGSAEVTAKRAATLRQWFPVEVVENDERLEERIVEAATDWRADGVLAFSEFIVHAVAAAARRLGLPSNSEQAQTALYDKYAQRVALRRAGVEVPSFQLITSIEDLEPALCEVGLPAVLKPVRGMGSLAVFEVGSLQELEVAYHEGRSLYEQDSRVARYEPSFILERRLIGVRWHPDPRVGDYNSVDSVVAKGRIVHLSIEDKLPLAAPFRETGHLVPSTLPEERQRQLFDLVERSVRALGVTTGTVHTEIKCTVEGPRILEINGRCGGGTPSIFAAGSECNPVEIMARLALGGEVPEPPRFYRQVALLTPQAPAEDIRITHIADAAEILSAPHVISGEIIAKVGWEPNWRMGTKTNLMRVIAASESRDEILQLAEQLSGAPFFRYVAVARDGSPGR